MLKDYWGSTSTIIIYKMEKEIVERRKKMSFKEVFYIGVLAINRDYLYGDEREVCSFAVHSGDRNPHKFGKN